MLKEGRLDGPAVPPGRAPADTGRVWERSVDDELARRLVTGPNKGRLRPGSDRPDRPGSPQLDAVQALKVSLDLSRELLRDERSRSRALTRLLADAVAELEREQLLADKLDTLADGYSSALTQLLTPQDAASLRPPRA